MRTVEPIQPGDSGGDAPARIAIVEDDYLVAFAMEEALVEAGFDVVALASSAEEILDLASTARPTLAVMDIRLNGARDGIDAALELFAKHGIRSVFATAYQTREMRARAEPARPLAWLSKPYVMSALVDSIRRALGELAEEPGRDKNAAGIPQA